MKMTVKEITAACGGKLLCGDSNTIVTSVSTDSRKIDCGTLFVPIKGERTDAHTFIRATFKVGAVATLTEEHDVMDDDEHAWISVSSTEQALQKIAAAYRRKFKIPFIGITGSVGKTTTKEMVALALSASLNVIKTEGNFNSQIGLPLTMFNITDEHQAAVIEMGMSNFGEMGRLAQIASPDYAVMTNIGISHIQQLKTQQNIMKEKLHITDMFNKNSVLLLNGDDAMLAGLRNKIDAKTIYFGTKSWCDFRAENIKTEDEKTFFTLSALGKTFKIILPALGMHNVLNALAGLAVADTLNVPIEKAIEKLETYKPLAMRQQIHHVNEVTIIDDSYNASPDAIKSSINVLCEFKGGKRIAVLADMLELGECSGKAHFNVGAYAAASGVDIVLTVGERAKEIAKGAKSVNLNFDCYSFENNEDAILKLKSILTAGDTVLIKGSRAMKTDKIVKAFL
jgi:UDP-N-acetylmuramoyl-tripeptide--D-alanyl-D-alanine ligase